LSHSASCKYFLSYFQVQDNNHREDTKMNKTGSQEMPGKQLLWRQKCKVNKENRDISGKKISPKGFREGFLQEVETELTLNG
jgi:hypothetical protein